MCATIITLLYQGDLKQTQSCLRQRKENASSVFVFERDQNSLEFGSFLSQSAKSRHRLRNLLVNNGGGTKPLVGGLKAFYSGSVVLLFIANDRFQCQQFEEDSQLYLLFLSITVQYYLMLLLAANKLG